MDPRQEIPLDEFARRQLEITSFEPLHQVNIIYPSVKLLRDDEEGDPILSTPALASTRHEPGRLVDDDAVFNHAGRDNREESSVFTRTRAERQLGTVLPVRDSSSCDVKRLVADMESAAKVVGSTRLRVLVYEVFDDDEGLPEVRIRFRRRSLFYRAGIARIVDTETYDSSLGVFADLNPQNNLPWVRSVLSRQNMIDRAVHGFQPERRMDFPRFLRSKLTEVDPTMLCDDENDNFCVACSRQLGTPDCEPVRLSCKHVVCYTCVLEWCHSVGPAGASCPHCRDKLFADENVVDALKYGMHNGVYFHDHRYNEWENFERSCADLDKQLAENKTNKIIISGELLSHAWQHLRAGSRLETAKSTPLYIQPARFPELDLVQAELEASLRRAEGIEVTTSNFFHDTLTEIYCIIRVEYVNTGLDEMITAFERDELFEDPTKAKCLRVRPGLYEFVKRTLNRMLQYQQLRQCGCQPGQYHRHGWREYYNPAESNTQQPQEDDVGEAEEMSM